MCWTRRPSMPRSSESVAALASALAKAQAELINPEKSLTATIRTGRPGESERSFRYAPLSSGLDIVRKTLGQHEIATLQTTAIDQTVGMVHLTTTLAHASGEWIASDWPVCPIADIASPQRMGAALTYARRYALFTLVGIAGEDDLDAPDLCSPTAPATAAGGRTQATNASMANRNELGHGSVFPPRGNARGRQVVKPGSAPILSPEQSTALRVRLLAEVAGVDSHESATSWAREVLTVKNQLTASDAKLLEDAFEQRLTTLPPPDEPFINGGPSEAPISGRDEIGAIRAPDQKETVATEKRVIATVAPRRHRDREHLRYVAKQPCLICGRKPSDPHHLRFVQPRALGRKASDEFAVPLCRIHHRLVHRVGNEAAWWQDAGIDPVNAAHKLWRETRGEEGRIPAKPPQAAVADNKPMCADQTAPSDQAGSTSSA